VAGVSDRKRALSEMQISARLSCRSAAGKKRSSDPGVAEAMSLGSQCEYAQRIVVCET
jgi:hypothetical protein